MSRLERSDSAQKKPLPPLPAAYYWDQVQQALQAMSVTYFKRYRMDFDLTGPYFPVPDVPADYSFTPWEDSLLEAHAEAKYRSFCDEIDANVFPCLGQQEGCRRLMSEIIGRNGFLGPSTWLVSCRSADQARTDYCGTVQGIRDRSGIGSIQNLGIAPEHRGKGLGTLLLYYALEGFHMSGIRRVCLEVTAQNYGAVRLYRRLGFRTVKTVYKSVEVAYA